MEIIDFREAGHPGQIVALCHRMVAESRVARLGFGDELPAAYAQRAILDPLFIAFGAFDGATMVGMVVGTCGATLPFTSAVVASDHALYVLPAYRGAGLERELISAFITEARARGAREIMFSNWIGYEPEHVSGLLEAHGLSCVGGVHTKEL